MKLNSMLGGRRRLAVSEPFVNRKGGAGLDRVVTKLALGHNPIGSIGKKGSRLLNSLLLPSCFVFVAHTLPHPEH